MNTKKFYTTNGNNLYFKEYKEFSKQKIQRIYISKIQKISISKKVFLQTEKPESDNLN